MMYIIKLLLTATLGWMNMTVSAAATGSQTDEGSPIGWASANGQTTGGNDENPVTVTTATELVSAMKSSGKKTIYIKGTINIDGQIAISKASDKTIYGLPESSLSNTNHSDEKTKSGILVLKNCQNIILRNLTFKGAGAYDIDGNDNLTIQNCQRIWVDHCDFQDGVDGNLDCQHGSDFITISWCRFRYLIAPWSGGSGGAKDHRYTNLIGSDDKNADEDEGHLRITYASCWWDEGCRERMPRIRFGQVHIVNCLYSSSVANYCVGTGYRCNTYVEKCVFVNQKNPWKNYATSGTYTDYNITVTDCIGAKDEQSHSGSIEYFNPYAVTEYNLTPMDKDQVEAELKEKAGATLSIEEGEKYTTRLDSPNTDDSPTTFYTLAGTKMQQHERGLCIGVGKDATGRTIARKFYK